MPTPPKHRLNFTKTALVALPVPAAGRAYHHDAKTPGLVLAITASGCRSFLVYRKLNGRPVRVTLGRFPPMTVEQARRRAAGVLAQLVNGIHPLEERRAVQARQITLREVLDDYLTARTLKPKTREMYRWLVENPAGAFHDWKNRPLLDISRDLVEKRHRDLTARSPGVANLASTLLGALFNFARGKYEHNGRPLVEDNPVRRLTATGAWCDLAKRTGYLPTAKLPAWWQATELLDPTPRDLLRLLLLTGLRKNEGAGLRWLHVDLAAKTLHVPETKNRRPLTLPLSDYLADLLAARLQEAQAAGSPYVFPSPTGKGHYVNALSASHAAAAQAETPGMVHDLRRTFITIAESLDIAAYAIKALVNHHTAADVTQGYLQINTERLRAPMQAITDFILKAAGVKPTAEVRAIKRA
ncbi:MAG: integrase family protein [Candidatus Contendobacter sp.]|nr:integrase family protein [Candidatus Contendobacter sp.]